MRFWRFLRDSDDSDKIPDVQMREKVGFNVGSLVGQDLHFQ